MFIDLTEFGGRRHAAIGKMGAIYRAFEQYPSTEWVWWLDMDAIIMTPSIDLYDHILGPSAMQTKLLSNMSIKSTSDVSTHSEDVIRTAMV